ncbi:MAG: 3'(2'),5'-bisphosphate nucleotidase CysQ [Pseudomonadales bacterium]|jgi:3'(2'), 5'-bisphosphate nucleotidase|nr:3'(2'),5'-bisphosphate nucleotidase CysQ [Pseudomonadales bacterium]MDA0760210.1 3'(2'),5'-bisphosphate nucleotidase CysQ [Pseudomonadota bacterium]MDA0956704.1 3'(2'),5'-bisphosphate nucleotidase CysQ [Pseudomonadota bacterium]
MIETLIQIARAAGEAILDVYSEEDFGVQTKDDDSPLTRADLAAHKVIVSQLAQAFPEIPVLSEESDSISFEQRASWARYFLVDPLDGTKEFIARNGEFTVNIALIDDHRPVMGVVHVPVKDTTYWGDVVRGEAAKVSQGQVQEISVRELPLMSEGALIVVASRRHGSDALEQLLAQMRTEFSSIELTSMGSSLKLCLVAEGAADFYPRLAPTSEWDTAAAHAVVLAAGGQVVDTDFEPLRYNAKKSLLNPDFLVVGDPNLDLKALLLPLLSDRNKAR